MAASGASIEGDPFAALELITPTATAQLQAFNSQVVAHLRNYKPEVAKIHGRLGELAAADEQLSGKLKAVESDVAKHYDQNVSSYTSLSDRLARVEQLMTALPTWKEDLINRIDQLARETRGKHDAAAARMAVLEDTINTHATSTRERLDMLTTVARTAAEARQQQQERIDEADAALRRLKDATEATALEHRVHLRRHDEQVVLVSSRVAEHGATLAAHALDLSRLRDSTDQNGKQLESLARGVDSLNQMTLGFAQEVDLVKRSLASTDATTAVLVERLGAMDADVQGRLLTLEANRTTLFEFKDLTHTALELAQRERTSLAERIQFLDTKVEAGPPGLWKMAAQVATHEEELGTTRAGLAAAKATGEELARRLDETLTGLAHQRDVAAQLRQECRMLADRMTADASRAQSYVDDQLEPLARRYEVEAVRKALEGSLERLEAALAGSGERLKWELLHDEAAQVGSIREYMGEVERRSGVLVERIAMLEAGLAGEAERGRSVAAATRDLRGQMDALLSTSQADLAKLRATLDSLHEEYNEMSKRARRAGLLTAAQVEEMIETRMNGPALDSVLAKKMPAMQASMRLLDDGDGGAAAGGLRPLSSRPSRFFDSPGSPRGGLLRSQRSRVSPSRRVSDTADDIEGEADAPSDPALALRVVTVEADVSRLLEALRALSSKVASSTDLADLASDVKSMKAIVTNVQMGQGVLGDAGEEAVRRHVHATLLPEVLQRQGAEARRLMGWMDEQLSGVNRELAYLRRTQAQLQADASAAHSGGAGAPAAPVAAGSGGAAVRQRSAGGNARGQRGAEAPPEGYAYEVLLDDGRLDALERHVAQLSELLGLPPLRVVRRLKRRRVQPSGPPAAAARPPSASAALVGEAAAASPVNVMAQSDSRAPSRPLSASTQPPSGGPPLAPLPEGSGNATGLPAVSSAVDSEPSGAAKVTEAGGDAEHAAPPDAGASSSGGGAVADAPDNLGEEEEDDDDDQAAAAEAEREAAAWKESLAGLTLSLPLMLQRVQQAEASLHAMSTAQQAFTAAAAGSPSGAAASGAQTNPTAQTAPAGAASTTAAAVQGLVDAAVSELRVRLRLLETEVPLMARSFEVKAVRRIVEEALAAAHASGAALRHSKVRANGPGYAAGGARGSDPDLQRRINSLELTLATIDERGRALEAQWTAREAKWGATLSETQSALPRLQAAVTQLAKEVQRAAAEGNGFNGAGYMSGDRTDGERPLSGSSLGGPRQRTGGAGQAAVMAEVANVELAGVAHDLSVAAHDELRRLRDGPLPDGTQDGLPTPTAQAAREAALARLRRKPRECQANVALLEGVKLHLDRLMRRAASCTTDRLVLLAAMNAMRVKLLENEAETFREQIITVFRSLERSFQALVALQEAMVTKGSAAVVNQLAAMVQDVSAGLSALAAHTTGRESGVLGGKPGASALASPQEPPLRRSAGDAGASALLQPGGPVEDALQVLSPTSAARAPSPTAVMRPASPARVAGPGVNTATHRQQAAAARGASGRLAPAGPAAAQQPWLPSKAPSLPSPPSVPSYVNGAALGLALVPASGFVPTGNPPPAFLSSRRNLDLEAERAAASAVAVAVGRGAPGSPDAAALIVESGSLGAASMNSGAGKMWLPSARRPASAVAQGLHVPLGFGGTIAPASGPSTGRSAHSASQPPSQLPTISAASTPTRSIPVNRP